MAAGDGELGGVQRDAVRSLQLTGFDAQLVQGRIGGQCAGHGGLLSYARVRESGREEVGHKIKHLQGG